MLWKIVIYQMIEYEPFKYINSDQSSLIFLMKKIGKSELTQICFLSSHTLLKLLQNLFSGNYFLLQNCNIVLFQTAIHNQVSYHRILSINTLNHCTQVRFQLLDQFLSTISKNHNCSSTSVHLNKIKEKNRTYFNYKEIKPETNKVHTIIGIHKFLSIPIADVFFSLKNKG